MSFDQKVGELMSTEIDTIDLNKSVRDVAKVLAKTQNGCVVVVRDAVVTGIVTEQDVVVKVIANGVDPAKVLVRDVMTSPVISVKTNATIKEAAGLMSEYKIRRLVATNEDGSLAGLITSEDLAMWLAKQSDFNDPALNALARIKPGGGGSPYQ